MERRKYAQDLIEFDKRFAKLFSGKPLTEESKDGVSHADFLKYAASSTICRPLLITSRIFQISGAFTSGIGVHYAPSSTIDNTHQTIARNIIIGERMPPQILIRAADSRPYDIHDLLPSDSRYKVLVFTGDTSDAPQLTKVRSLASEMDKPNGFLAQLTKMGASPDIIAISSTRKANERYSDLPELFRAHWSK